MKSYKYNSVAEMFRDVLGEESVRPCRLRHLSNSQKKKNAEVHKAICDYIKMLETAFEASKGSTLTFDI